MCSLTPTSIHDMASLSENLSLSKIKGTNSPLLRGTGLCKLFPMIYLFAENKVPCATTPLCVSGTHQGANACWFGYTNLKLWYFTELDEELS